MDQSYALIEARQENFIGTHSRNAYRSEEEEEEEEERLARFACFPLKVEYIRNDSAIN